MAIWKRSGNRPWHKSCQTASTSNSVRKVLDAAHFFRCQCKIKNPQSLTASRIFLGPSGEIRSHGLMVPNQSAMCRSSGTSKCGSFFPKARKALIHLCFLYFHYTTLPPRAQRLFGRSKRKSAQIFEVCALFVRQRKRSRTTRPAPLNLTSYHPNN